MDGKSRDLYEKLVDLEKKVLQGNFDADLELRSHKSDIERLRDIVSELKEQDRNLLSRREFDSVGKEVSVTSRKLDELSRQIEDLEKRTDVLEQHKSTTDERVWTVVEKILVGLIGGAITYIFSHLG